MAERRMFAKTIIDSDAFLDMPMSAQCLYFHLAMRADDDGFLNNPKRIQRVIGASDDDLRILLLKKFLIAFENGVVVIKHWRIHNYIQKDRYKPTVYQEEKSMLDLKKNGAYTECVQIGDTGKVSIGKVSIGKNNNTYWSNDAPNESTDFDIFWSHYPRKVAKAAARKAFDKVNVPVNVLVDAVEAQKLSSQWKRGYIPNPTTWLNQGRWEDQYESAKEVETSNPFLRSILEDQDDITGN